MMKPKTVDKAEILSVMDNGKRLLVYVWDVDGTEREVYVVKDEEAEEIEERFKLIDYEGDAAQEIIEEIMHDERFEPFLGLRLIVLLNCYYAKKRN